MVEQPPRQDRIEFETPPYGGSFILKMVLWAFGSLGLQIVFFWMAPDRWWSNSQANTPSLMTGPLSFRTSVTVMPGGAAVVNGELWASIFFGTPQMPGATMVRPASSRLIAIDLKTGKTRETKITLSPAPAGLLTINDQLWCVAETVIYHIENGEAIPRYPRRTLIQPSKPFVHEGRMAVIDKNRNNVATLLTWNEGEWTDEGQIDVPVPTAANRWVAPELRVLSDGQKTFVFYSEGQNILYREGFSRISATDPEPASALEPENLTDLDNTLSSMMMTNGMTGSMPGRPGFPGWKSLPIAMNWWAKWDVALINGEPMIFSQSAYNGYNSSPIQQHRISNGNVIPATPQFPPEMSSFGVAGGSTGYLVTDDLSLFQLDGSTFERVTTGRPMTERFRSVLARMRLLLRYLFATGVMVLGTWALMRSHRKPEYLYGKRTVIQASIIRRAVARGIDLLLTVFPALFWFSVVISDDAIMKLQRQTSQVGIQNPLLFVLLSIFGMWLGITLMLCYMEGYYGFTPGKWFLGIRTLRTTLRPCGMLRSFARELLVYIDGLFFLTWLPGVLLIAFTPHWQRLGDLTADTVVINASK